MAIGESTEQFFAVGDGVVHVVLPALGVVATVILWVNLSPDSFRYGMIWLVIGIGVDFTACTILPVTRDGTPLCFLPKYRDRPHAWVKLWKHHAAQPEANKLNAIAARGPMSVFR